MSTVAADKISGAMPNGALRCTEWLLEFGETTPSAALVHDAISGTGSAPTTALVKNIDPMLES
jgi:hypothetical protein